MATLLPPDLDYRIPRLPVQASQDPERAWHTIPQFHFNLAAWCVRSNRRPLLHRSTISRLAAVDRAAIGFTPIPTNANVRLEMGPRSGYDAMLHVYAATHRTIAFRKTPDGYAWIAEQEIHYGPKMFTTVDGDSQEHIVVEFQFERVNGIPTNQIHISYAGEDTRLARRDDLTLTFIKPILEEGKGTTIR